MLKKAAHFVHNHFMNSSLTRKLVYIYVTAILIPTVVMMLLFIHRSLTLINDAHLQTQNYRINSATEALATEINQIASYSNYFQQSNILKQMLAGEYKKTSDFIFYYTRDINPLIDTAEMNSRIQSVSIIGFENYPFNMKRGLSSLSASGLDTDLVEKIKKKGKYWNFAFTDDTPKLFYYRLLTIDYAPYTLGIVQFQVDIASLAETFCSQTGVPIYMLPENQVICYDNHKFSPVEKLPPVFQMASTDIHSFAMPNSNLELLFYTPKKPHTAQPVSYIVLFSILVLIIFTVFYGLLMLSFMKRIKNFALHLKHSDAEKMEIFYAPSCQDEIGLVIDSYNELVNRINELINENLKVQIQKKESDFYALQAQIHPHFLYNILENIRMSAEMHHDSETGNMLLALGKHMRYTLNMNSAPVPLKDELTASKNYLQIHQIRMKEKLNFEILISTEIDNVFCPRFVFQPLLENAISHGYRLEKPLFIRVLIEEYDDSKILITIEDDGNGMSEPTLQTLNEKLENGIIEEANHVGLLNVNRRLMSYLHSTGGVLKLYSEEGTGTKILFTLNK